jgi:hypothetical protein
MENHSEQLSSREAVKIIGDLSRQFKLSTVSVSDVAKLLHLREDEILDQANKNRSLTRRHFVDKSGLVSAAISLALLVGFIAARFLTGSVPNSYWVGSTTSVRAGQTPKTAPQIPTPTTREN